MAVDEGLLEAAAGGQPTLRFYRWSEPTLSLGYFQSNAERAEHVPSSAAPMVRRQTGGGAIVHDVELTYSLALPAAHRLGNPATQLYRAVHDSLLRVLATLGVSARLAGDGPVLAARRRGAEPFLCFLRRTSGDVLAGEAKIGGSAQRRLRGAILQHGSVLLERSACAPELPGIFETSGRHVDPVDLATRWAAELGPVLEFELTSGGLSEAETLTAALRAKQRYGAENWTLRR